MLRGIAYGAAPALLTPDRVTRVARMYNSPAVRRAAQFMWKNRKSFVRMARARRQDYVSQRAGIGTPPDAGNAQSSTMLNGNTANFDTRTPYGNDLTLIAKSDDGLNTIDERQRQTIIISGFSLKWCFINRAVEPMFMNIAVVNPKNQNTPTMSTDGFFRDYNLSRDVNFSTSLSGLELHSLPISTDKFRVLAHKRFVIPATSTLISKQKTPGDPIETTEANASGLPNIHCGKLWVPLRKGIKFNDDSDDNCESKCFAVFWFDTVSAPKTATAQNDKILGAVHAVTYWTEMPAKNYRFNSFRHQTVKYGKI